MKCRDDRAVFNGGGQESTEYTISGSSVSTQTFPDFEKFVYSVPINGSVNVTGLSGTVALDSNSPTFTEALFTVGYSPLGKCPTNGQRFPDYDSAFASMPDMVMINQYIIKAQGGHVEVPVDYQAQYPYAASGCFFVAFDGSAGNSGTTGTMSASIQFNTVGGAAVPANQMVGLHDFEHFPSPKLAGSSTGQYLEVNRVSSYMHVTNIVGSIANAAFDGTGTTVPTGNWNTHNVFYHVPSCFGYTAGTFQDQDFFSQVPASATVLYDISMSAVGRSAVQREINESVDLVAKPGDCFVQIVAGNSNGSLNFESALFLNAAVGSGRPVLGTIDSINASSIQGWACQQNSSASIQVQLYLNGNSVGIFDANQSSESAIAQVCGSSGTAYRFSIPMTSDLLAQAGAVVTMYGVADKAANNNALANSGMLTIPWVNTAAPASTGTTTSASTSSTAAPAPSTNTVVVANTSVEAVPTPPPDPAPAPTPAPAPVVLSTQSVYRYVTAKGFHVFALNSDGAGLPNAFNLEGAVFSIYSNQSEGLTTLMRCRVNNHQFLSTDANCEGQTVLATFGYIDPNQNAGEVPLYRMSEGKGDHLEVLDPSEGQSAGYTLEGVLGFVPQP